MLTVSTLLLYTHQTTLILGIACGSNCESPYPLPGSDMLTANVVRTAILHF